VRSQIGGDVFEEVRHSRLASVAAAHSKKKKTYNNVVSALRCAFDFGYKDPPEKHNPAPGLNTLRRTKKDRQPIDPFTIQEGEAIIALSHAEFGPAHGHYEEFRFFTGLRQSEEIALKISDCDLANGKIRITHVRVRRREKDRTKTGEDRDIALCRSRSKLAATALPASGDGSVGSCRLRSSCSSKRTARPSSTFPIRTSDGGM
jgi:integrase